MDIPEAACQELSPIVGAASASSCPHSLMQLEPFSAVAELPAIADDTDADISIAHELFDPGGATELVAFLENLLRPRRMIGIAAFVLFALVYRLRVRIWYVDHSEDIVERYAPWAVDYITEWATVQAVACKVHDGRLRKCSDSLLDMGHWVGAYPNDGELSCGPEGFKDAEDEEFFKHYHDLGLQIERTECMDDCGIDTMSLMLGEERSLERRIEIRRKLVKFVIAHRGNRALMSILTHCQEMTRNLGTDDLESAGQELFTHRCHGAEPRGECSTIAVPVLRSYTDEETDAVKWKLNMYRSTASAMSSVMAVLSEKTVAGIVLAHKSFLAEPPAPKANKRCFILGKDPPFTEKRAALHYFFDWCSEKHGLEAVQEMRRQRQMPRGYFADFVRDNTVLKRHLTQNTTFSTSSGKFKTGVKRYMRAFSWYCHQHPIELDPIPPLSPGPAPLSLTDGTTESSSSVVTESSGMAITPWAKNTLSNYRIGRQHNPYAAGLVCDCKRRRQFGGGRHRKCMPFRETFTRWFGCIRFSIDVKIMCRVPISFLLAMARHMYRQYVVVMLELEAEFETVDVSTKWVKMWLIEVRLAQRMPNRKYKVKRWVLKERLCIFWINTHKWRKWVFLEFGYDPDFRNVDQCPIHKNESGSKNYKTITCKNGATVPLCEGHAATRERMSVSSVTDSNEDRIKKKQLPGVEVMFEAEGKKKQADLQKYADDLKCPFKLSVVTGPSGSYKEEDLIAMQDKWLEDWGPGRRSEGWLGTLMHQA